MGAPAGQTTGESEIILRTDDGAILSVVQAESSGLAPGARVVVLTSPNLHLARPGYTTPTS
jgi:outer membrane lipoprotein SlyB